MYNKTEIDLRRMMRRGIASVSYYLESTICTYCTTCVHSAHHYIAACREIHNRHVTKTL